MKRITLLAICAVLGVVASAGIVLAATQHGSRKNVRLSAQPRRGEKHRARSASGSPSTVFASLAQQPVDTSPAAGAVMARLQKPTEPPFDGIRSVGVGSDTRAYVAWNSDKVVLLARNPDGSYVFGAASPASATDPRTPLWLQEDLGHGPTKVVALLPEGTTNARVVHKDGTTAPVSLISDVLSADLPAGARVAFKDASGGYVTLTPSP